MTPVPEVLPIATTSEDYVSSSSDPSDLEDLTADDTTDAGTTAPAPSKPKKKRAPKKKLKAWNPSIGEPGFESVRGSTPDAPKAWVRASVRSSTAAPGKDEHGVELNNRSNLGKAYEDQTGKRYTFVLNLNPQEQLRHVTPVDVFNKVRQGNAQRRMQDAMIPFEGAVSPIASTIAESLNTGGKNIFWWFHPGNLITGCIERLKDSHGDKAAGLKPKDFTVSVTGDFHGTTYMPRSVKVYCKRLLGPSEEACSAPEGTCIYKKGKGATSFSHSVATNFMGSINELLEAIGSLPRVMSIIGGDFIKKITDWDIDIDIALKIVANFHFVAPKLSRKYWVHFTKNCKRAKLLELAECVNLPFTGAKFFHTAGQLPQPESSGTAYDANIECAAFFKTISVPGDSEFSLFRLHLAAITDALSLNYIERCLKEQAPEAPMLYDDTLDPDECNDNTNYFGDPETLSRAVKNYVINESKAFQAAHTKNIGRFLTKLQKPIGSSSIPDTRKLPGFEDHIGWKKVFETLVEDLGIQRLDFNSRVKNLLTGDFAKLVREHLKPDVPLIDLFTDLSMFRNLILLLAHHLIHEKAKNKSSETVTGRPALIEATLKAMKKHTRTGNPVACDGIADLDFDSFMVPDTVTHEGGTTTVNILPQLPVSAEDSQASASKKLKVSDAHAVSLFEGPFEEDDVDEG